MKRVLFFFCALTLALSMPVHKAEAQFWKKLFGKDDKPVKKQPARQGNTVNTSKKVIAPGRKKAEEPVRLKLANSINKSRYRIDVLVPLYLNELVSGGKPVYKNHLPDKVLPGLNFYQGIKLAADTLNTFGYHLDVYVHDIADPAHNVDALLKANKLDSADLIIGAVQAQQVSALSALAKKKSINFVSALSPADANVRGNLYFNLLQPTLQRHCEVIRNSVAKKARGNANILIYRRSTVPVDEQCFRYITADSSFSHARVMVNTPMPTDKLRNFLDSNTDNIIVMPILDVTYATQMLEQLNKAFPKYRIEVYGMPSWKGISLLHKEGALPNFGITIGSPFYFDPSASAGRGFAEAYNRVYGGKPSEMAYRGYETLYWYAYLLKRYGTIFNEHFADNGSAPFTRFDMKLAFDKQGNPEHYENDHVYLYRYQGGSFSVEQ